MSKIKFNTNYKRNTAKSKEIQEIVDALIKEKVNPHPFDFLFRRNSENYPKTNHQVLELPGIFKQKEGPNVYTINGRSLQQDFVETALPDGENLFYESTLGLEQLAYLLTPEKTEIIYLYKNFNISKHKIPSIPIIVTNINYKTDELACKINGEFFTIKIIYFSPEKIDKILNSLGKKDYSKEEMSEVDFLSLVHCLIFATKENAKKVIKKIVDIFVCCEKIQEDHQLDLHLALKIMIKYHYKDKEEVRRMLTMITQAVSEKPLSELSHYEQLVEERNELKIVVEQQDHELIEKQQEIAKNKQTIAKNKQTIAEKDRKIEEIEVENKRLRAQLEASK